MDVFEAPSMGRKRNEALKAAPISWGVVQNLGGLALGNAWDKSLDLRWCVFFVCVCSWAPPTCLNFWDAVVPGLLGRLLVLGEEVGEKKEWVPKSKQVIFIVSGGICQFREEFLFRGFGGQSPGLSSFPGSWRLHQR